jgi:NAD(P)-dependent dehydrogenase (short-subunit alcohol dehydrogenase family)
MLARSGGLGKGGADAGASPTVPRTRVGAIRGLDAEEAPARDLQEVPCPRRVTARRVAPGKQAASPSARPARAGYRVVASMRDLAGRNAPRAAELARRESLAIDLVEIDIDQDASVERGVAMALNAAGRVDILVNNAGIIVPGPVEVSMDAVRRQFETNLFGQLRLVRAVAPHMREQRSGLIVQISSGLGRFILPTNGVYCATKFATEAMMESAAYELHPFGIELAIVQPGAFATNFKPTGRRLFDEMVAGLGPADRRRAEAYAEHMEITRARMADERTPPAQMVADAILALARMPAGQRPLRAPVMPAQQAEGLNRLNATLEGIQQGILRGNGMAAWLTLRT